MKLHLGCGSIHIKGYVNIDIRYQPGVDEIDNIKFLRKYQENSVDVIYACAVVEHFGRWEYKSVLQRWYEILKSNGILRISVPDWSKAAEHYTEHKDLRVLMGMLHGGQDYELNFHHTAFDFKTLSEDLYGIGFKEVYNYEWRDTEHGDIDDFSQSYIPHMDKESGMLMHLNIEAIK